MPAQAGMMGTQLLVAVLLARSLTVRDRGTVLGALLLIGLGVTLVSGGLTVRAARAARVPEAYGRSMGICIGLYGVATIPILWILAASLPGHHSSVFSLLVLGFGPLGVLSNALASTTAGEGRLFVSVVIQWLPSLTAAVGIGVISLAALKLTVEWALALYLLGTAFAGVMGAVSAARAGVFDTGQRRVSNSLRIFRESLWMTPAAASQLLGLRFDSLLLTYIAGPGALSIYAAANSMVSPMQIPVSAGRGRIIARGEKTLKAPRSTFYLSSVWLLLSGAAVLLASPLISLLFGHDYAQATLILPALVLAGALQFVRDVMANTLLGAGFAKGVSGLEVLLAGSSLPIYLVMIHWQSYLGAALASSMVYSMGVAAFYWLIRRRPQIGRI